MNDGRLHVGDTVLWRGGFGAGSEVKAVVTEIEVTNGRKYGDPVESLPWDLVSGRYLIVTLNNGHWAYASQISPVV